MKIEHGYAGADWIARSLKKSLSPFGVIVADILGFVYRGIYHIDTSRLEKVNWGNADHITITLRPNGMSTFDGRVLTDLVIACHDCFVRLSIEPCNGQYLRLLFSQRVPAGLGVSTMESQPSIEWQLDTVRTLFRVSEAPEGLRIKSITGDDPVGFQNAPTRYTAKGRETIDRIRDELGDDGFVAFCIGNAMKYEDRAGLKGDAESDLLKARWYRAMALHVTTGSADPRSGRPGFQGYRRPETEGDGQ